MPLTPAQSAFFLYGWHSYAWAGSARPATSTLVAAPAAIKQGTSVAVQLPAGSLAASVTAESGERSGAPDKKSPTAQVAGGGLATLPIIGLTTGRTYYVRAVATYADGTQALTAVETQVVPT